jgi:hypothetical protein
MGNSLPQKRSSLKKSRSLREYTRSSSLITSCISNRRSMLLSRTQLIAPTDGEIIDISALRCQILTTDINEKNLSKQLDYIHSCVRKDKGLFGKYLKSILKLIDQFE